MTTTIISTLIGVVAGVLLKAVLDYLVEGSKRRREDRTRFHDQRIEVYAEFLRHASTVEAHNFGNAVRAGFADPEHRFTPEEQEKNRLRHDEEYKDAELLRQAFSRITILSSDAVVERAKAYHESIDPSIVLGKQFSHAFNHPHEPSPPSRRKPQELRGAFLHAARKELGLPKR